MAEPKEFQGLGRDQLVARCTRDRELRRQAERQCARAIEARAALRLELVRFILARAQAEEQASEPAVGRALVIRNARLATMREIADLIRIAAEEA